MGSYQNDGKINLERNLKQIQGIKEVPSSIELPITVEVDGYDVKIKDNGEVREGFNPEKLTIGVEKATNTDKYGWKVKKYNVQYNYGKDLSSVSDVWRLFYQDDKYTYLITNELVGIYNASDYYNNDKYLDGTKMSIVGQKLNGRISSIFTDATKKSQENIRATVWFTDTENELWTKFKDTNGDAEFAIASPTAELFEVSYNKNTNPTHNDYKEKKINVQLGDKGYITNTEDNWLRAKDSHGIYNKDDKSYCWIASPRRSLRTTCMNVNGYKRIF